MESSLLSHIAYLEDIFRLVRDPIYRLTLPTRFHTPLCLFRSTLANAVTWLHIMRCPTRTNLIWKPQIHLRNTQRPSLRLLQQQRLSELVWDLFPWIIRTVLQDKCTTQSMFTGSESDKLEFLIYSLRSRQYAPTAFRSCHFCGQMFQERELARHLETHQPKEHRKRYYCSACPETSFARHDILLNHQSIIHGRKRKSSSRR